MIVDLSQLEGSGNAFDFMIALDTLNLETDELRVKTDIEVSGEISKNAAKTDVSGNVAFAAEIDCTRCLTPIEKQIVFSFDVTFVPREALIVSEDKELGADDLDVDALNGDELDMKEIVREQILLTLPEKILCKEDCKGLCEKCGSDLNLIDCSCRDDEIDPRWAALKNLN